MKSIRRMGPHLFHYGCSHYGTDHLKNQELIKQKVQQDLADSDLSLEDIQNQKVVIDFLAEGQCDHLITGLVNYLVLDLQTDIFVVFNASVDTSILPYKAVSMPEYHANHMKWFDLLDSVRYDLSIDAKFLCLMRRPAPSRAQIGRSIVDLDGMRLSFGNGSHEPALKEYKAYFPGRNLPIMLDGSTISDDRSIEHDQRQRLFHSCLFNIVVETSSQTDPHSWRSIFITEKTYKAFGLRQIPIWFAVPNLVAEVRKLGFDLFDDIVNHDYDRINDQNQRFQQVLDIVRDLNNRYDLSSCQALRYHLAQRLEHNYQCVKSLSKISEEKLWQIIKEHGKS